MDTQCRAAVAEKRQRNTGGRQHTRHHGDIQKHLHGDEGDDTHHQQRTEAVPGVQGDPVAPQHQRREEQHDDAGADEAQLLADNGENKIVVLLRQKQEFLPALAKAQSPESPGADGNKALRELIALIARVRPRVQPVGNAGGIIANNEQHHIRHGPHRADSGKDPAPVDAAHQHHGRAGAQNQQCAGEVRLLTHKPRR